MRLWFTIASAVSAVACFTAAVLFSVLRQSDHQVTWQLESGRAFSLEMRDPHLAMEMYLPRHPIFTEPGIYSSYYYHPHVAAQQWDDDDDLEEKSWQLFGFKFGRWDSSGIYTRGASVFLIFPCWLTLALTAILPALWCYSRYAIHNRNRRIKMGLCSHCGYDIRASPGRCSECGYITRQLYRA